MRLNLLLIFLSDNFLWVQPTRVSSVVLSDKYLNLDVGEEVSIQVEVLPNEVLNKNTVWLQVMNSQPFLTFFSQKMGHIYLRRRLYANKFKMVAIDPRKGKDDRGFNT